MAENDTNSKNSTITRQLKSFLNFNTLTSEILSSFVDKIEVTNKQDVKIFYKFSQVEGL
ncbi:DUF4368 domain-containing protein [Bacillus sp. 7705b]|uniref:DUF4368 domain-containing protein n=1 Tax=Bacillus sp. 7705b TaxID=2028568 RepID=UPI0020D07428|nr:DUF4368 domain-containing protein [Bacillus sp. 7705b]